MSMVHDNRKATAKPHATFGGHERRILVLQGGGALGAYQAGVYEGLDEAGFAPNWGRGRVDRGNRGKP